MNFQYLILESNETPPEKRWYRYADGNPHTLRWESDYSKDWRGFRARIQVAGLKYDNRTADVFWLATCPDFFVWLKRQPDNPHDANAIMVWAAGTVSGAVEHRHIGYLPKEDAAALTNETALNARPFYLEVPHDGYDAHFSILVLVRSAAFKKKNVDIICPGCGRLITAPKEYRGQTTHCANCETAVIVP